jgi:hypothetical protein
MRVWQGHGTCGRQRRKSRIDADAVCCGAQLQSRRAPACSRPRVAPLASKPVTRRRTDLTQLGECISGLDLDLDGFAREEGEEEGDAVELADLALDGQIVACETGERTRGVPAQRDSGQSHAETV